MLLVLSGGLVMAQSGTVLVYGNLDLQTSKDAAKVKTNQFSFTPGVGYQWNDNWTGGINLNLSSGKVSSGSDELKASGFGAGPFVRYAYPLSSIFAVYGQLNTNMLSAKIDGVKSNGFEAVLFPAIGVNLKNGFALNFNFGNLSFVRSKVKGDSGSTNDFALNFGSGAGFGISKNFGK